MQALEPSSPQSNPRFVEVDQELDVIIGVLYGDPRFEPYYPVGNVDMVARVSDVNFRAVISLLATQKYKRWTFSHATM
jgi:hypothetical protein